MIAVESKVAFGAGGSGIGPGIVEPFVKQARRLRSAAVRLATSSTRMEVLQRFEDRVHPVALDVGDAGSVEAAAGATIERLEGVLVNNAVAGAMKHWRTCRGSSNSNRWPGCIFSARPGPVGVHQLCPRAGCRSTEEVMR